MASTETLQSVAALLPTERRERFLSLCARFESVPEDDEYLQILEAIGFMTLLWKEVPGEVSAILEGANPVSETCHSVAAKVREAVIESIPSYDDLKKISQRLESHELALKNTLSRQNQPVDRAPGLSGLWGLFIFVLGLVLGFHSSELIAWTGW
jgi:hypothetical protein